MTLTVPMTEAQQRPPRPNVLELKLQLFHRLQRRHRSAWKRYWRSFQRYLVAKLSLDEFHAVAEELLGPDKHLHNKFVLALLSTAYQEAGDVELSRTAQLPLALGTRKSDGGIGEAAAKLSNVADEGADATRRDGSVLPLQTTKDGGGRHVVLMRYVETVGSEIERHRSDVKDLTEVWTLAVEAQRRPRVRNLCTWIGIACTDTTAQTASQHNY